LLGVYTVLSNFKKMSLLMTQPKNILKPIVLAATLGLAICTPKAAFAHGSNGGSGGSGSNGGSGGNTTVVVVVVTTPSSPSPTPQQPTRPRDPAFVF
jgi:hypothetical protein